VKRSGSGLFRHRVVQQVRIAQLNIDRRQGVAQFPSVLHDVIFSAGAIAAWQELLRTNPGLDQKPIVEQMIAEARQQKSLQ
jgi:hypothetical protein